MHKMLQFVRFFPQLAMPVDLSGLVARFYPALQTQSIVGLDVEMFTQAVTFLRSYLLTAESKQTEGDCLFLLEAMGE